MQEQTVIKMSCKVFRLLFVSLIGMSLFLSSCKKEDDKRQIYGQVAYNRKVVKFNTVMNPFVHTPSSMGVPGINMLGLANVAGDEIKTLFIIIPPYIYSDYEIKIDDGHTSTNGYTRYESISFIHGDKVYATCDEIIAKRNTNETIIIVKGAIAKREETKIVEGFVKWTVGETGGHFEFDLVFEDGLTARGYGYIPFPYVDAR